MTKNIFQFFILCLLSFCSIVAAAQAAKMPPIEERTYEDWFTFKHGKSYTYDPWAWAYTAEFAQRFKMPKQWIEPELKGALAVAFRMTTIGRTTCGLGGRADNCWPTLECQMDVYFDNSIQLPWNREDIQSDFLMKGISSQEYLDTYARHLQWRAKYAKSQDISFQGVGVENGLLIAEKDSMGSGQITYYDKEIHPGVGIIGWVGGGMCPHRVAPAVMNFFDPVTRQKVVNRQIKEKDAPVMLRIELPVSYMERINAVYERDNKPNDQVTDRLIKQFFDSKKISK